MGAQAQDHAAPTALQGVQHCPCMSALQHHSRHTWATRAWAHPGLLSQSEMPTQGHGHVCCPWHRCRHTVTQPMARAGADTGRHRRSQVCPCSITAAAEAAPRARAAAPANQLRHTPPTRHTPTQTAVFLFPNSQRCRQTATLTPLHLLQTPTHCCLCPEGMDCAERTLLCLPPLCLDFPERWAVLG